MAISALDDTILGNIFVNEELQNIFTETKTIGTYLQIEVALAQAQAETGLIPTEAAAAIATITPEHLDTDQLRARATAVGFPIAGLVEQLATVVPDGHGQFAHWGATTQDIMDTAVVLQLREALAVGDKALADLGGHLARLANEHRSTVMVGRSQLQPAAPTTFGHRAAGWLDAIGRHQDRIDNLKPRLFRLQLGGAVGTMAAIGPTGQEVHRIMADKLNLAPSHITWHTGRDSFVEAASVAAGLAATLGKIGKDIAFASQAEVAEMRESATGGRGISSTMPQKQNPVASQALMQSASIARAHLPLVLEAAVADNDRGTGVWPLEWVSIVPIVAVAASAAITARDLIDDLVVDVEQMARNVEAAGEGLMAEATMMALAPSVGRQTSHDLVEDALHAAQEHGTSMVEELAAAGHNLSASVFDPANYRGTSETQIDAAIARFNRR